MTTLFSRIHPAIFVALALAAVHRAEGQVMVPTNPSDQTVLNATGVLAQTMTMQSGIPQNLLAGAQGIVIVPNMIRGAFVFRRSVWPGRASGAQSARRLAGTADGDDGRRQLWLSNWRAGDRPGARVSHPAKCGQPAGRHAEDWRRCVGRCRADRPANFGGDRFATGGRDPVLLACAAVYSRAFRSTVRSSRSIRPPMPSITNRPARFPPPRCNCCRWLTPTRPRRRWSPRRARSPAERHGCRKARPTSKPRVNNSTSSRQLATNLDDSWKEYLALPPELYTPNQSLNPQALQQSVTRYEEVARDPKYAALTSRPDFQATLQGLRQMSSRRTAANPTLQLPPPPR